jgi:hypothetical protein
MPAEHLDMTRANGLHIEQGADWDYTMVYAADADASGNPISPINLTGFTARMALKVAKNAPDPPIIALTTTNGRIVLGGDSRDDPSTHCGVGHVVDPCCADRLDVLLRPRTREPGRVRGTAPRGAGSGDRGSHNGRIVGPACRS